MIHPNYQERLLKIEGHTDRLNRVVFGDESSDELGMKKKVDEIHQILVQAKGLKGFLYIMIAIGGAFAVLKGWVIK